MADDGQADDLGTKGGAPEPEEEARSPDDTLELELHRTRVLLVEDDAAFRFALRHMLQNQGYDVIEAADGAEAYKRVRACEPVEKPAAGVDVVVTDLMMPHVTGLEFLALLRQQNPVMAALMMSGFADDQVWELARQLGVSTVLPKPFHADDFLDAVERLMPPWHI